MRKRKAFSLFAVLLLVVSLFSGCKKQTSTGGKMHYDLTAEPVNLDPQTADDLPSKTVINQIFEMLFTLDENGGVENAAAEDCELSSDGLVYTITVREGLIWSDGKTPLTAEDYAFGLKRILMEETQSPFAKQFYGIQNGKAYHSKKADESALGITVSGNVLTIALSEADENFLHLLASTAAAPCNPEFFESTKGKYGLEANALIANGPFYLESWVHEEYCKLTKNKSYRDVESVKIAGVTMWSNNAEGRDETFWNGKTHACYVDGKSYAAHKDGGYPADAISNTVYGIAFHQSCKPLQNEKIRKAMAALFDRDSYAKRLPEYLAVTDRAFASDCAINAKRYLQTAADVSFHADTEQAMQWYAEGLQELGIGSVSGLKIIVPEEENLPVGDFFLQLSQSYQKYLSLYIGIERLDAEAFAQAIENGDYDMAILPLTAQDLSPQSVLSSFASGNFACTDQEFLSLYQGMHGKSTEQLMKETEEAERILLEGGWFIPMYEQSGYFVCGKRTAGIAYNPYTGLVSFRDAEYLSE